MYERLFLAVVGLLPVMLPLHVTLLGSVVIVADWVFLGAAVAWIVALVRGTARIRWDWFYAPLALYVVAMIASTLASEDPRRSAFKLVGEVYLVGLGVLTFNVIGSLGTMRRVAGAWLGGTVVTVLAGAVGIGLFYAGINDRSSNPLLSDFGSLPPGHYPRISALFLNPNMLCTFLVVSFLLALGMRAARWLDGVRFWLLTIGIMITIASTISAGLGGLVLGGGLWAWMRLRGSRHTGLRPIILVGSHAVALVFFLATAVSPVTRDGQGVVVPILHRRIEPSSRVLAWRTAFETVKEHPVLGRGLGLEVSSAHYLNASGRWEYVTDAHNVWLSVAGQTGVVGLLAFGTIILYLVKGLAPLDPRGAPGLVMKTSVALAFVGAFLYQSLSGSFEDTRHLWVLIGMLAAARRGWDGA